jgi:uncharacterized protein
MGVFCLEVGQVKESPREFRLEADRAWWERARTVLREPDVEFRTALALSFQAHRLGMRLLLQGDLQGSMELICGRCVEPYHYEFAEAMHLLLEPASPGEEMPEGGMKLDPDDLEIGRYVGDVIDLGPLVMEILALGWPVQPRCDEECRGLCPVCGSNRNRESCSCTTDSTSRPFARLGKLLSEAAARTSSRDRD